MDSHSENFKVYVHRLTDACTHTNTHSYQYTDKHTHPPTCTHTHKLHSGTVNHIVQYRYCHVLATSVTGTVEATGYSQNQD